MSQPRILLNAIVKNEIVNLPRMLKSVLGHVTAAVIADTGSDDGTPEFIHAFFKKHHIPCRVVSCVFKDFEQARNFALLAAQQYHGGFDYIMLMDADMELQVDGPLPPLTAESYALEQQQGGMAYHNVRLLRKGSPARYHGVTHEFLDVNEQAILPPRPWWFMDHATGSNRSEKYERDTRLLEAYLGEHPGDGRSLFYLAQTYRDRGLHEKAIELYKQRIVAGGWDEEIWYSRLQIARSYRELKNEPEFIRHALDAYNSRPVRVEPIYDLANYYRLKDDKQQIGWLFAQQGAQMPYPNELLFNERWVYDWGMTQELSILGAYNDKTKAIGLAAANKLSLMLRVPAPVRENARRNLFWYIKPLGELCTSFRPVKIPQINPNPLYTNSNPSVAVVDGKLKGIVRTVSYRIRPDGTYDYNGLSSIRTTSYLCDFNDALDICAGAVELQRPTGLPEPISTDVLDIEDLRLIPRMDGLWANGCMLEQNPINWREQFLVKINPTTGELTECRQVEPQGILKQHEKNWMPILGGAQQFMYRPGVVMNWTGAFVVKHTPTLAVDQISGGGQVVSFEGGWVAIVHEARPDPTNGKRWYQHRFIYFDDTFQVQKVSQPFVFFDKQIEFAAGLARMPGGQFVISFGVLDREAWLTTFSENDVRELIWQP